MTKIIYERLFKEARQVGVIYHFTYINNIFDILNSGLKGDINYANNFFEYGFSFEHYLKNKNKFYGYCFTRDKNIQSKFFKNQDIVIVLDGNKMSENYKIFPIAEAAYRRKFQNSESEERLISKKSSIDLKPYIKEIKLLKTQNVNKDLITQIQVICEKYNISFEGYSHE